MNREEYEGRRAGCPKVTIKFEIVKTLRNELKERQ
jgi:hypothetical protein